MVLPSVATDATSHEDTKEHTVREKKKLPQASMEEYERVRVIREKLQAFFETNNIPISEATTAMCWLLATIELLASEDGREIDYGTMIAQFRIGLEEMEAHRA